MDTLKTTRYNLDTSALLVELTTSVWTARKLSREVTDEVVQGKNAAAKDAARVNLHLLAGRKELEVILQHVGNVRNNYVYPRTLPWSDAGLRLLPTTLFMEFNQRMQEEEQKFWDLVEYFVKVYPTLITAQAMALGDMFKRDDFPSASEIENKFAFNVNYIPVPTAGDFRVDVGNAAVQELQQQFEKFTTERVENAMNDVRQRLKEHLVRMSDRLSIDVVGGEVKARIFHDSLLEGALDLVGLVKSLNVSYDPDVENVRRRMEQALVGVEAKELRKNVEVRRDVKKEVDSILKGMSW